MKILWLFLLSNRLFYMAMNVEWKKNPIIFHAISFILTIYILSLYSAAYPSCVCIHIGAAHLHQIIIEYYHTDICCYRLSSFQYIYKFHLCLSLSHSPHNMFFLLGSLALRTVYKPVFIPYTNNYIHSNGWKWFSCSDVLYYVLHCTKCRL